MKNQSHATTQDNPPVSAPLTGAIWLALAFFVMPSVTADDELPELDCVIEPSEIVDIGSATAGVLETVAYDRGDLVRKNQVVAKLESSTEKAAAELARVRSSFDTGIELRRTSADFFGRNKERSGLLTQQSAISKQQLDQLDTEAQVAALQVQQEQDNQRLAKLEYRRAQEALRRRAIKSPIDGVVVERYKAVGEYVEDTAIMRVAQLHPLHVETIVPVSYMGKIKTGMQAQVTPAVPGQSAQYAVVSRIDRVADAASGTFGVRLTLDNPDGEIATGVRCALQFDQSLPVVAAEPVKQSVPRKVAAVATPKAVATNAAKNPTRTAVAAVTASPLNTMALASAQCFEAGPIAKHSTAGELIQRLTSAGNEARLREIPGEYPGQFFVLTEQASDLAAGKALVAEMAAQGITDTHLLKRGVNARKISLGLFGSRESAERRLQAVVAKGFTAHIAPRDSSTLFLDVATQAQQDVNGLRRLLGAAAPERIKAVPCATLHAHVN